MARLTSTIAGRITFGVVAVHLLVLPALYFGLVYLIKDNNEEMFLNSSRGHARYLADSLERVSSDNLDHVIEILDSVVLSGSGVFSELIGADRSIKSSLIDESAVVPYAEDYKVGDHDDDVYYISVPVLLGNNMLNLHVGFDETPVIEQNALAYKNGLIIIGAYLLAISLLMPVIGRRVAKHVRALQFASREIASGALSENLRIESNLVEFVDLSNDLERMKSRLIGMNQQLESEIEERKATESKRKNLEQQLRHSQRLETVGTMAGGIAHELNNILVPIILNAEMAIEDSPADSSVRKDMQLVLRAAMRAKGIVSQVLTFSSKMEVRRNTAVNMATVIHESIELLRASKPPDVSLRVDLSDACPPVLGDAALLSQLILNLCTNAIQSLRNSAGTVTVSLDVANASDSLALSHPSLAGQRLVRLTVSDNGAGMNRETKNRIFEPFFTTRSVGKGTGLGLSVVHGIVTDANGAIEVESELQSGSTFHVYFPAFEISQNSRDTG